MNSHLKRTEDQCSASEFSCDTFNFNQSIHEISDIAHKLKQTNTRKKTADKNAILLL